MKIKLKKINLFSNEIGRTGRLYNTAFPADERAPFAMLAAKTLKDGVELWSLYADGEWFGFAYVVSEGDVSYLFYFAVDDEKRGMGLGSRSLKALQKLYCGSRLFLALEQLDEAAENYPVRLRRRRFYMKNGMTPLDRTVREGKVVYDVMSAGGDIQPEEYGKLMADFLGFPLNRLVSSGKIAMEIKKST